MARDGAHPGDRETPASPGNQESPSHSPFRLKTYIHAFSTIVLQPIDLYVCTAIMYLWSVKVGFDDTRQFCERGRRQLPCGHPCRTDVVTIAIASVLLGGIRRALRLPRAGVRERTSGDHEPLVGSRAFAFEPCLHPADDHLDVHRPFLAIAHRQPPPCMRVEGFPPLCYRLPRGLRSSSTTLVRRRG